jgi:LysM repeat protein
MTILFVLSLLILQPTRFEVETKKNISSSAVYAKVTEKSANGDDGSVKFDMFIPGSNESGDIVYAVASGDTLSEIAKKF